jgi:alkylation response protein AidB-like acyl-CoA dehydrogenase
MDFSVSPRAAELTEAVRAFIRDEIAPVEHELERRRAAVRRAGSADLWQVPGEVRELQRRARAQGLWNLFLPAGQEGPYADRYGTRGAAGLTNVDYAPIAEATGWSFLAPSVFNCNAPDSGNAEVLLRNLPEAVLPKGKPVAWVMAFDLDGRLVHDLRTDDGSYGFVTGVARTATGARAAGAAGRPTPRCTRRRRGTSRRGG